MDVELVGLTEIAMRAGVQKPVVATWRTRHDDFPAPAALLAAGPVWYWHDVRAWLERTGRKWDCHLTREEVNRSEKRHHFPKGEQ